MAKVNGASTSTTLQHSGLGQLTLAWTNGYADTVSDNLQTAMGGAITEACSYSTTDQPHKLTGCAVTCVWSGK
jgi:hypothetical protein